MNIPAGQADRLERRIGALLRELPELPAPASLEARVLAGLAARRALPWWREGFMRWPLAARCLFLPVAAGCADLALLVFGRLLAGFTGAPQLAATTQALAGWRALREAGLAIWNLVAHAVPLQWLYACGLGAAMLYVMFFSLSAVAMRMLLPASHPHRT